MLVQLGNDLELMGKGKLKAAIQKVSKKLSNTPIAKKIGYSKVGKAVGKVTKTKAGKILVGALALPLAPTLATAALTTAGTALATGAAVGTTIGATKLAMAPFKKIAQIKKAKAEKKAEQQAAIEADRQAQLDAVTPQSVLQEQGYSVPVSSRTDAGIETQVSPVAKAEEQKKNDFLKYAIPIGIAALSLLSSN